jgi:hypothetical protein
MVQMSNFMILVQGFGGFHDSIVTSLAWSKDKRNFCIGLDKSYANFAGLVDLPDDQKAEFSFVGATVIVCDIINLSDCKVFEMNVEVGPKKNLLSIDFSPRGRLQLSYDDVVFPDMKVPVQIVKS